MSKIGTCEDRGYKCCETLSRQEHRARYGYAQASAELDDAEDDYPNDIEESCREKEKPQ